MEQYSGVTFQEAQVALARQWIGQGPQSDQTTVTLVEPQPMTNAGLFTAETSKKIPPKTVTVQIPPTEEEARLIVERFEAGSEPIRDDENVKDSVAFHVLLPDNDGMRKSLMDELWVASEEEELNAFVFPYCVPMISI